MAFDAALQGQLGLGQRPALVEIGTPAYENARMLLELGRVQLFLHLARNELRMQLPCAAVAPDGQLEVRWVQRSRQAAFGEKFGDGLEVGKEVLFRKH
ncbi:MAG TPA: hypothetical protein VN028_09290 [Rhodocyclaceae bacterium]|nr:hypothetical protein [Rhodocyclaceae bacterium]